MSNYYRVTGYCPEKDFAFIIDCYGKFEKKLLTKIKSDADAATAAASAKNSAEE